MDFTISTDQEINIKENKKRYKYLDLARERKASWKTKVTVIPIITGALETVPICLEEGLEELEIGGRVHQNYSITKIGKNTNKSLGDLTKLAASQTPVKDHQLTLGWKLVNNNNNNPSKKWKKLSI